MQTFLPYPNFYESAKVLDYRRLGKQRVEAKQILNALRIPGYGWRNHPAVLMWKGHVEALKVYHNTMISEWISRGYKNTMPLENLSSDDFSGLPTWILNEKFHSSHRAALLHKNYDFYKQYNWKEEPKLDYYWPTKQNV